MIAPRRLLNTTSASVEQIIRPLCWRSASAWNYDTRHRVFPLTFKIHRRNAGLLNGHHDTDSSAESQTVMGSYQEGTESFSFTGQAFGYSVLVTSQTGGAKIVNYFDAAAWSSVVADQRPISRGFLKVV